MKMETTAKLRHLRMSPRKVRLLVDLVKGKSVQDALLQLALQPKLAARPLKKLIESAIANAEHNHSLNAETLVIKNAFVDGGPMLKRFTPRAFGRAAPIRKRTSHVTVILEGDVDEKAKAQKLQKAEEPKAEEHNHSHEEVKSEAKTTAKKAPRKRTTKKEDKE